MKKKNTRIRPKLFGPTQKDIADALGLAQSTVATALNPQHEHKLLPETVSRIREYAAKIGYRPQRFAQIMRGGPACVIGVVVRPGGYTSHHEAAALLANALTHRGYQLVVVDPQWFGGDAESVRDYLTDQSVDGVVFYNLVMESEAKELAGLLPAGMPVISMQSALPGVPSVHMDVMSAFDAMTRHHMALGSRRLALLLSVRDAGTLFRPAWTVVDRARGFSQAIRAAGGTVEIDARAGELLELTGVREAGTAAGPGPAGVILYPEKPDTVRDAFDHGYYQMLRLIDAHEVPDSLLCSNDDTALGAMAACGERGLRVPQDIRISGYDNTRPGAFSAVALTTIRNPLKALAEDVVSQVLELVQGDAAKGRAPELIHPGELIFRGSTATAEEWAALDGNPFGAFGLPTGCVWKIESARLPGTSAGEPEGAESGARV